MYDRYCYRKENDMKVGEYFDEEDNVWRSVFSDIAGFFFYYKGSRRVSVDIEDPNFRDR